MSLIITLSALILWSMTAADEDFHLPKDLNPLHYDLAIAYDLNEANHFPFYGVVKIQFHVIHATIKIVLHAKDYEIWDKKVSLIGPQDDFPRRRIVNFKLENETTDFLVLTLSGPLTQDANYTLSIPFFGNVKMGALEGAYISSYVDLNTNQTEYLITTQFEAVSARNAFPCFDEPIWKSIFSISLGHSKEFQAISNMPVFYGNVLNPIEDFWSSEVLEKKFKIRSNTYTWNRFEPTLLMSTYLVAYVISKLSYEQHNSTGTQFRSWARKDALAQTSYASSVGPKILKYLEELYDIAFPIPKIDMIAIPDFPARGMENWGLITYREDILLYDNVESSIILKEISFATIVHELSHQWFGNLVTMKWWNDMWLNEGFTKYMEIAVVTPLMPQWKYDEVHLSSCMQEVLTMDSLLSSYPVSVQVEHPKMLGQMFDDISYKKGAALIHMLSMLLKDNIFWEAINNYLVRFSYSNTDQDDFWSELTSVAQKYSLIDNNVTIKNIMDTWTVQTGYPVLRVNRSYEDGSFTVKQKRYLTLPIEAKTRTPWSWWIPLNVLIKNVPTIQIHWLAPHEVEKVIRYGNGTFKDDWAIFNHKMMAPLRVSYDQHNWNLLAEILNSDSYKSIPTLSRAQLVDDAINFAWTNDIDSYTALNIAKYLRREKEYAPLNVGLTALKAFDKILMFHSEYNVFQAFMRDIITPAYHRSGGLYVNDILDSEDVLSVKMQILTSREGCHYKVPGCEEHAVSFFKAWMKTASPDTINPIPVDLREIVYCVAVSRGSVAEWNFLLERLKKTTVVFARASMVSGLTCTKEVWLLKQLLNWTITEGSDMRRYDANIIYAKIIDTTVGYSVTKDFMMSEIQEIFKTIGENNKIYFYPILGMIIEKITNEDELNQILQWKALNTEHVAGIKAIHQGIERARSNIDWLRLNNINFFASLKLINIETKNAVKIEMRSHSSSIRSKTNYMLIFCFLFYLLNTVLL